MKIWKRNAVVVTVILFVCVSLYLSWSYNKEEELALQNDPGAIADVRAKDDSVIRPEAEAGDSAANPGESEAPSKNDYFSQERLRRQKARDSVLTLLKEVASQEGAEQAAKDAMSTQVELLARYAMAEARIEGLVMAKGFAECVAFLNEASINIVVAAPEGGLLATDVAKIRDIVIQEAKLSAADITIVGAEA